MSKVKDFAAKVVDHLQDNSTEEGREFAFDPSIILVIAEALIPLIKAIQECRKQAEVPTGAANPSPLQRLSLRLHLRNSLVGNGDMSPREFGRNIKGLMNAILDTTKNSTKDELAALFDEVGD